MLKRQNARVTFVLMSGVLLSSLAGCGDSRINKANFEKISKGMTLKEVEAILGPGTKQAQGDGSAVGSQFGVDVTGGHAPTSTRRHDVYEWESGARKITIFMDGGGRVAETHSKNL